MTDKLDAYRLNVKFTDKVIGELSLNKEAGFPVLMIELTKSDFAD